MSANLLVPSGPLFSINLVPEQRMFLGQAIYVLRSYEADVVKPLMCVFL